MSDLLVEVQPRNENSKFIAYHDDRAVDAAKGGRTREEVIDTKWGPIVVTITGDVTTQPVIITYHDVGLNHGNCFQSFMYLDDAKRVFERFAVIHFDAPGHQIGASALPPGRQLTVRGLAMQIEAVLIHLKVRHVICFGIGAGATVLCHYASLYRNRLLAMILVGGSIAEPSWPEWIFAKTCISLLRMFGMHWIVEDHLMGKYFSERSAEESKELLEIYSRDLKLIPPVNIAAYMQAILNRTDVSVDVRRVGCDVLQFVTRSNTIAGSGLDIASACDPRSVEAVEVEGGHLLTEQRPDALLRPIALFLQGLGYNQDHYLNGENVRPHEIWHDEH